LTGAYHLLCNGSLNQRVRLRPCPGHNSSREARGPRYPASSAGEKHCFLALQIYIKELRLAFCSHSLYYAPTRYPRPTEGRSVREQTMSRSRETTSQASGLLMPTHETAPGERSDPKRLNRILIKQALCWAFLQLETDLFVLSNDLG